MASTPIRSRAPGSPLGPGMDNVFPTNGSTNAGGSLRTALRSEPERLKHERTSLQHEIQALSLSNFQVHIQNHHCTSEVRNQLSGAVAALPALSGVVSALASEADGLESDLAKLHGEHTRLRRTLTQHNALLELLEAPSVMEACVRSGMLDEALDVADYATGLFFTHKLWATALDPTPSPNSQASAATADGKGPAAGFSAVAILAAAARTGSSDIVRAVVGEIRALAADVRDSILSQLSGGRVTLPLALKLLGHLRRLYTQQVLARKRSTAHLSAAATGASAPASAGGFGSPTSSSSSSNGGSQGGAAAGHASLGSSAFAVTSEEDAAIVARVRQEFLAARDAWHRGELDTIPRHNSYQYVSVEAGELTVWGLAFAWWTRHIAWCDRENLKHFLTPSFFVV